MSMLDAALAYAERGLCVFALKPREKVPATASGCKDGSADEADVRAMWGDTSRNIGIATGVDSGVFVLDVDGPEGDVTFRTWQALYGALPPTPTVQTARGLHVYFRHPGEQAAIRNSAGKAGDGIDVRTDGGYVVAPPSIHPSGDVYHWADGLSPAEVPFANAPDWLIAKLVDKPRQAPEPAPERSYTGHTRYGQRALDEECMELARSPEGQRNQKLNLVAFRVGQLVAVGHLGEGPALADLRRSAFACGLEERETRATIASGFDAGQKSPNPNDPRPEQHTGRQREPHDETPSPVDEAAPEQASAAAKPSGAATLTAYETAHAALMYISDEKRRQLPRTGFSRLDDAIGGMPPGTMHVIGGRTGSGKSSLMLAMALRQHGSNQRVGIVSCEDAEQVWGTRLIQSFRDVSFKALSKLPPDAATIGECVVAVEQARALGIHFSFQIAKPIRSVLAAVHALVTREGCNVIMVDYLQAIKATGQDRYIARTDAAQDLKGMCHELGVPLVIASQLKRATDGSFKPPTNNDLKDSGDIENMAESILLMWPKSDEENAAVIGKVTKVKWSPERPRFLLSRNPISGSVVSLVDPPPEQQKQSNGRGFLPDDRYRYDD